MATRKFMGTGDGTGTGGSDGTEHVPISDRSAHTGTQSLDTTTDSPTRVAMSPAERAKLTSVEEGATQNSPDAELLDRSNHTGTQTLDTTVDTATRIAMSPAERTKLSNLALGATANRPDAELLDRSNHTGTQNLDTTTDSATRVAMAPTERSKLAGIATGATQNDTNDNLRDRATHTGTQDAATVTGLAPVATSGSYPDLYDKPSIPSVPADIGAQPAGDYTTQSDLTAVLDRSQHTGTQSLDTTTDSTDRLAMSAAERLLLDSVTHASTSNSLVKRDVNGDVVFGKVSIDDAPSSSQHAARMDYVDAGDTAAKARENHTGTQLAATISDFKEAARNAELGTITDGAVHGSQYQMGVSVVTVTADRTAFPNWPIGSGTVVTIRASADHVMQYGEFDVYFKFRVWTSDNGGPNVPGWTNWYVLVDGYPWTNKGNLAVGPLDQYGSPSILAPGTNGQVLTTDSTTWTGLKWSANGDTGNTPSTVARRDSSGNLVANRFFNAQATPGSANELTPKSYVDALGTPTATADTVVRRNANNETWISKVYGAAMTTTADATQLSPKGYVDTWGSAFPVPSSGATSSGNVDWQAREPNALIARTLSGNITSITLPNTTALGASRGSVLRVALKQAATGGPFTVTMPPGVTWVTPVPTMPTAANAVLLMDFIWTGTEWLGMASEADLTAATASATANTLVRRSGVGNVSLNSAFLTAAPTGADHATRKDYVDASGASTPVSGGTTAGTWTLGATDFPRTRTLTLGSNTTLNLPATNPDAAKAAVLNLLLRQDATGGRTLTFSNANGTWNWAGGVAPTMPTAAGATMAVQILWTGTEYWGFAAEADLAAANTDGVAGTLVRRSASSTAAFSRVYGTSTPPGAANELTRKDYVDAVGTHNDTASTIVRRDVNGQSWFQRSYARNTPASNDELTRKDYVDAGDAARIAIAGGAFTGNVAFPKFDSVRISNHDTTASIAGDDAPWRVGMGPFGNLWHDLLAFHRHLGTPIFEQRAADGTTWAAATLSNAPFTSRERLNATVFDTTGTPVTTGARWTWNSSNLPYNNARWLLIAYAYTASAPQKTVLIESSSNGTTWTTRHNSTYLHNSMPVYHPMNDTSGDTWIRVTITGGTPTGPIRVASMRLLTNRWGDQGAGSELEQPYQWNENGWMAVGHNWGYNPVATLDVAGAVRATSAPTVADHLTRKDYVDTYGASAPFAPSNQGGAVALAVSAPRTAIFTLTGNVTLSFGSGDGTRSYTVTVIAKQAATGGPFTLTWPTLVWAGGAAAPQMPATANAELVVHLFWTGVAWRAMHGGTYFP